MNQRELLQYVANVLDDLNIDYYITGSMATILYGTARQTHDIDVVAAIPPEKLRLFCHDFPEESFYLSEEAAREALKHHSQFNIIHDSGLKIDIFIPDHSEFSQSRLARRVRSQVGPDDTEGNRPYFASPEDIIIKKMEYYREGGSDKHLSDIAGIFQNMGDEIDQSYIEQWVSRLDIDSIWQSILERIKQP